MVLDQTAQGHYNRYQGFYGESLVQTLAAAAHLKISRQLLEPEGIDFQLTQERPDRIPRCKHIEVQVKTHSEIALRQSDNTLQVSLKRKAYQALNGRHGVELTFPRYLVIVNATRHFSGHCKFTGNEILFTERAYWHDLMGQPDLPEDQGSVTVSVPAGNLLTPETLVRLTCGDREEAAAWMSA